MTIQTPQGKVLFTEDHPASQGPMSFFWTGKDDAGKDQAEGRFTAVFTSKRR